jgi:hypothetical protein
MKTAIITLACAVVIGCTTDPTLPPTAPSSISAASVSAASAPPPAKPILLEAVLEQVKNDVAGTDWSPAMGIGPACGTDKPSTRKVVPHSIKITLLLLTVKTGEKTINAGGTKIPIPLLSVLTSPSGSIDWQTANSHQFEMELMVDPQVGNKTSPTNTSELGSVVAGVEYQLLNVPGKQPCLTPSSMTVTRIVDFKKTIKGGVDFPIKILYTAGVSGSPILEQKHYHDPY